MTKITEEMLHAFVDGQLSMDDMQAVEDYLNAHPEKAEEIADWSAQNDAIRAIFPPEDTPTIVVQAPANTPNAPRFGMGAMAAAAAVLLALGVGGGWLARGQNGLDPTQVATLVDQAVTAHLVYSIDPHRPVEVKASEEETLVRWLSNRVGEPLQAPDLSTRGFDLIGGRLVSATEGPAAQFMYENGDGTRITLFAVQGSSGQLASFQFNENGEERSFYWEDDRLTYALVGAVEKDDLSQLAQLVYQQLDI